MNMPRTKTVSNRTKHSFYISAGITALYLAMTPLFADAMGVSTASAGFSDQVVVEFPGIASASDSGNDGSSPNPVSWHSTATASPGGISASVSVTGLNSTGTQYGAGGSFTSAADTTFNYSPNFQGEQSDWVEFELGGFLTGTITGEGLGGTGWAVATISLFGPLFDAPNGGLKSFVNASSGNQGGSVRSFDTNGQQININKLVSTGFYWVPRGEAISFSIAMSVTAFGDKINTNLGTVTSDFSDTFKLNPEEIFTIRTPGITVNSPSAGIVNNALPAPVPLPGALLLFLTGLLPLGMGFKKVAVKRSATK